LNEHRLGFNVNFLLEYGTYNGTSFYDGSDTPFISGLIDRTFTPDINQINFPYSCKDRRNFFLASETEGNDLNISYYTGTHPRAPYFTVFSFGDAFITNYKTSAQVGDFPRCSVSYTADNMEIHSSGSGISNPSVNPKTRQPISNGACYIPSTYIGTGYPSVLLPKDITLDFVCLPMLTGVNIFDGSGVSGAIYPDIYDIGASFSDIKIQSYELNLPMPRTELNSLGYKVSIDKQLNFPIIPTLNVNTIVGEFQTGSFLNYLNKNDDYNITVKLKQPPNDKIGVQYDFRRAKLDSFAFSDAIGNNKTCNMVFSTEIDPDNTRRGLFVSGLLNQDQTLVTLTNYLLKEDGSYLLKEDGGKIIIEDAPILL
jgi:hypothetical protein